mgnify:CR=1 FL=1|tara:strand:- start:308 stop:514 length:207 start_codon:yes stop_codon:yes gene_type:complete
MKDKTLKILLGIIAVNLTIQTVKDVGLFPAAYAQGELQQVEICGTSNLTSGISCANVNPAFGLNVNAG